MKGDERIEEREGVRMNKWEYEKQGMEMERRKSKQQKSD